MPLQQLVEYFNNRLEWEHHANFRPFFLKNGIVHGLFGPIRIGSELARIRENSNRGEIVGYSAGLKVTATEIPHLQSHELELILSLPNPRSAGADSIVNFDRLARTVHMLNFLLYSHEPCFLQLEVDPRHILGVKADHGAYFQEVINKCGLAPQSIVICLRISSVYANYFQALLKGLENYRQRNYRVALRFEFSTLSDSAMQLIAKISPDFVGVSATHGAAIEDHQIMIKLHRLCALARRENARTAMFDVADRRTAVLAEKTGFDWVQGHYVEQVSDADLNAPLSLSESG